MIETAGATEAVVMLITLLVAVGAVVQLALEVMVTLTWSPFARLLDVYVGELLPVFTPFTCH